MTEIKAVVGRWPSMTGTDTADVKLRARRALEAQYAARLIDRMADTPEARDMLRAMLLGEGE